MPAHCTFIEAKNQLFALYKRGIVHKLCHFLGKVYENYPTIFIYTLHLQHFTMETKTLVIAAAVMIAATAAFALTPLLASSAMALRNGGQTQTTSCTTTHNGNGASSTTSGTCDPSTVPGNSASQTQTTTTCTKVHGKFVCTTS
jgi:hypothetical protein